MKKFLSVLLVLTMLVTSPITASAKNSHMTYAKIANTGSSEVPRLILGNNTVKTPQLSYSTETDQIICGFVAPEPGKYRVTVSKPVCEDRSELLEFHLEFRKMKKGKTYGTSTHIKNANDPSGHEYDMRLASKYRINDLLEGTNMTRKELKQEKGIKSEWYKNFNANTRNDLIVVVIDSPRCYELNSPYRPEWIHDSIKFSVKVEKI